MVFEIAPGKLGKPLHAQTLYIKRMGGTFFKKILEVLLLFYFILASIAKLLL